VILASLIAAVLFVQDAEPETTEPPATGTPVLRLDAVPQPAGQNDIVLQSAGQYVGYHRVIGDLRDSTIDSGDDLDVAMDSLSSYLADERLARAWLAYASLVAEQNPQYLDDVREVADYYGAAAAISGLMNDPAYATAFRHSDDASATVLGVIDEDSDEIRMLGEQYRQAAYDLQHAAWAQRVARDRETRLSALSASGDRPLALSMDVFATSFVGGEDGLGAASSEIASLAAVSGPPRMPSTSTNLAITADLPYEPDRVRVGRILSIAALRAIGDDSTYTDQAVSQLLSDPLARRCLSWARINMAQCVAAGHFKYEDSFCIAQHLLIDVSDCLQASQSQR
jgi:hypothetical protein